MNLTLTDLKAKNVDARITVAIMRSANNEPLEMPVQYRGRDYFTTYTVQALKQETIDLLVASQKNMDVGEDGGQILRELTSRFTEKNLFELVASKNYMLLLKPEAWSQRKSVLHKQWMKQYPALKQILKDNIFTNQSVYTAHVDNLINMSDTNEMLPYKDYEKFRQRITFYHSTPVELLEYYKDYVQDPKVLAFILNKRTVNDENDNVKFTQAYQQKLERVQKYIAAMHSQLLIQNGGVELQEIDYHMTIGGVFVNFLTRNKDAGIFSCTFK